MLFMGSSIMINWALFSAIEMSVCANQIPKYMAKELVQIAKIPSNTLSLRSPGILKPFNAMIHRQSGPGEGWIFSIVDCSFLQCSWTVLMKFWKFCIPDEQVLRAVQPISDEDVVLGQYEGYKDDPTVPKDSSTPTFASIILRIKNERWDGRMPELTL
jgi:hypothetical protein